MFERVSGSAVVVWVGMLAIIILATIVLGLLAHAQNERELHFHGGPSSSELDADATIALESAQRAETAAMEAADSLAKAEAERDNAWEAHNAATKALEAATADLPKQDTTELGEISRAAREAYRRGDLSVEELRAVWHRLDDWDRTTHERAHELSLLRAEIAQTWRKYRLAALTASSMRRAADIAQIAADALAQEAIDAAKEAATARPDRHS